MNGRMANVIKDDIAAMRKTLSYPIFPARKAPVPPSKAAVMALALWKSEKSMPG